MLPLAVVGNISEFFDIFLIGFVVSVLTKPWNLTGTEAGVILACSGLGTVIGAIMWGRLADKIGRRSSFFWCVLLFVVFTVVSVFTPDRGWIMLAILRIGVGIGVGGLNITSIPYVQEFVPAKQRGLLAGLASVFIPLGLFLGSLAQNALGDNWRALIALGAIPVFLLVWIRFVPESPRFLQSHGRDKEAREALAWALDIPADDIGDLPAVEHVQDASYSLVFGKYRKSLLIVSLGSFCFILGSFTIQSWGQTLLKTGFGKSPEQVGTLFMFVSLADLIRALPISMAGRPHWSESHHVVVWPHRCWRDSHHRPFGPPGLGLADLLRRCPHCDGLRRRRLRHPQCFRRRAIPPTKLARLVWDWATASAPPPRSSVRRLWDSWWADLPSSRMSPWTRYFRHSSCSLCC